MNHLYFDHVIQAGQLYLDYVFYEFESEPILFTCVDKEKKIYLCLCSDIRYAQRWLIVRCSVKTLKDLVEEKIDVASAFLARSSMIAVDMDIHGKESSHRIAQDRIDRLDLPKAGTYLKCDKEKANQYLWDLEHGKKDESMRKQNASTVLLNYVKPKAAKLAGAAYSLPIANYKES